jgi:hypothetical protein
MRTATRAGALGAFALACLCLTETAVAGPSEYVESAIVEEGEREIDFKGGMAKLRDGQRETQDAIGFGWGATSWWFTELYAQWHKEPTERYSFDAWEWENRFQLTETGKYPVDIGFLLEIERPRDRSEGYEIRFGPLMQADLTPTLQANLNLLFEKHVNAAEAEKAEFGYQWQLKYRWRPALEWGVQGLGDVGAWDHWEPHSEQPHQAGPALFGRWKVGDHQTVSYNAGLLFGLTDGAPHHTLRFQAEFEF